MTQAEIEAIAQAAAEKAVSEYIKAQEKAAKMIQDATAKESVMMQQRHGVPDVFIAVKTADCQPIIFADPCARVVGVCHAGWRGTALGIVRRCIEAMHRDFCSEPGDIEAAIGPCIGPCCFETDANVPQAIVAGLGAEAEPLIRTAGEKFFPDLKKLNALWLRQCGVRKIDLSCDCTRCQPDRFWSHRVTGNARGSQAAVILLREREETR